VDADNHAALAEDRQRVPDSRRVGDAELLGQGAFAGQPAGVLAGCDAGGDGVCHLLVGVLDAGAVYCRVVVHLSLLGTGRAVRFVARPGLRAFGGAHSSW